MGDGVRAKGRRRERQLGGYTVTAELIVHTHLYQKAKWPNDSSAGSNELAWRLTKRHFLKAQNTDQNLNHRSPCNFSWHSLSFWFHPQDTFTRDETMIWGTWAPYTKTWLTSLQWHHYIGRNAKKGSRNGTISSLSIHSRIFHPSKSFGGGSQPHGFISSIIVLIVFSLSKMCFFVLTRTIADWNIWPILF